MTTEDSASSAARLVATQNSRMHSYNCQPSIDDLLNDDSLDQRDYAELADAYWNNYSQNFKSTAYAIQNSLGSFPFEDRL